MKDLTEGDLYNQEQVNMGSTKGSKTGIKSWKKEVSKQLMSHLKNRSPKDIENIINSTFGNTLK